MSLGMGVVLAFVWYVAHWCSRPSILNGKQ